MTRVMKPSWILKFHRCPHIGEPYIGADGDISEVEYRLVILNVCAYIHERRRKSRPHAMGFITPWLGWMFIVFSLSCDAWNRVPVEAVCPSLKSIIQLSLSC